MKTTYAMAEEGSAFVRDGIDLSWPRGGEREVIEVDLKTAPESFRLRVHHGVIAEVEGMPTTKEVDPPTPYKLYEGEDAKQIFDEPAAPVVVVQHSRRTTREKSVTLLDPVDRLPAEPIPTVVSSPTPAVLARSAHRRG